MIANLFFDLFSAILLGSAVMVVSSRNPVHSVLFLILCFINAAILFLSAGAEFLALVLDVDFSELREGVQRYAPIGAAVGLVLFVELAFVMVNWVVAPAASGLRLLPTPDNMTNTAALGSVLYTKYIFLFQLAGAILLVSMIGAIVLTLRDRKRGKTQNIDVQHARMPADTLSMVNAKLGEGAELPTEKEGAL
jgi:NADH-quinone oxidoreductase subunit J